MLKIHKSLLQFLKIRYFPKIFQRITKNSTNLFLRGGDIISIHPQLFGVHEELIAAYIDYIAENGSSDFLIDIGANIGLSSCPSGNKFKKVYCFEPNPILVNILKSNLAISLEEDVAEIFDFALGDSNGQYDLYIPKHNFGGAFIREGNDYSEEILSNKDNFNHFNDDNYIIRSVEVKDAEKVFGDLFSSLASDNLTNGIIKIDVEGFEKKILSAIANSLPPSLNISVIFENHYSAFDLNEIKNFFEHKKVRRFIFKRSIVEAKKSKFRKYFELLFIGETFTLAQCNLDEKNIGSNKDVILQID